ncbi:MAG: RHS repeat domain-containing protein, partial [Pseudomonadota bacterium]
NNGQLSKVTDWKGNVTTYIHNHRGQELSRTEASGTPHARTIFTHWHPAFNLPIKITAPARETVMTYDTNGRLLSRQVKNR